MADGCSQRVNRSGRREPAGLQTGLRGQSEPLAALVSVAAVCLAISIYAGVLSDTIPDTGSERAVAKPAADSIWQDVSTGGVYDQRTEFGTAVSPSSLPEGYHVSVSVTVVDTDGSLMTVGSAEFDDVGQLTTAQRPEETETVTRPVSVRLQPGDVRPGRLTVEVWE